MIDPRNLPYARVYLSRLTPRELPRNALEQYHNYVAKRKSSDPMHIGAKKPKTSGMSVQHVPVHYSFLSGESDPIDADVNTLPVAKDTSVTCIIAQSLSGSYSPIPIVDNHLQSSANALNVAKETTGTGLSSHAPSVSYSNVMGVNDHLYTGANSLTEIKDTSVTAVSVQSPPNTEVDTKTTLQCRRNSVGSTSSSHSSSLSRERELTASVSLSPVTWDRPRRTSRQLDNCKLENEAECSHPGTKSTSISNLPYFRRTGLKPRDFSYEDISTVTSSSSTADASEQGTLSDECTLSALSDTEGFTSFKDHVMFGCEDIWPDFNSYSPPESPVPQNTDTVVSEDLKILPTGKFLNMDVDTMTPLKTDMTSNKSQHAKCKKTDGLLRSRKSEVRRLSTGQSGLLSPKVKLVPLDRNGLKHSERRLLYSNVSPLKRKSLSPKGDVVVKLSDIGDRLKPCSSGGVTVVKSGRYTTSGRRIPNYSEKSLAKSAMKATVVPEVKKRKARKKVSKSYRHGVDDDVEYHPGQKGKKQKQKPKNPAGRMKETLLRYDNLRFKELNTIPRMSTRYKVAFTKWPYVFSGALDLINQRISNQNTFWNSIRS